MALITKWITVNVDANLTKTVKIPYTVWTTSPVSTTLVTTKPSTTQGIPEWKKDLLNQLDNILSSPKWSAIINSGQFNTHSLMNKVGSVKEAITKAKTRDEGGKVLGDFINFVDSTYQNLTKQGKETTPQALQTLADINVLKNKEANLLDSLAKQIYNADLKAKAYSLAKEFRNAKTYGDLKNALSKLKQLEPQIAVAVAGAKLYDTIMKYAGMVDDGNISMWLNQEAREAIDASDYTTLQTISTAVFNKLSSYFKQKNKERLQKWFNGLPFDAKQVLKPYFQSYLNNPSKDNWSKLQEQIAILNRYYKTPINTPEIPGYVDISNEEKLFNQTLNYVMNADEQQTTKLPEGIKKEYQKFIEDYINQHDITSQMYSWLTNANKVYQQLQNNPDLLNKLKGYLGQAGISLASIPLGVVAGLIGGYTMSGGYQIVNTTEGLTTNPTQTIKQGASDFWKSLTTNPTISVPFFIGSLLPLVAGVYVGIKGLGGAKLTQYREMYGEGNLEPGITQESPYDIEAYIKESGIAQKLKGMKVKNGTPVGYQSITYDPKTGLISEEVTTPGKTFRIVYDPETSKMYVYNENLDNFKFSLKNIKNILRGNKTFNEKEGVVIDLKNISPEEAKQINALFGKNSEALANLQEGNEAMYDYQLKQLTNNLREYINQISSELGVKEGKALFKTIKIFKWNKGKLEPEDYVVMKTENTTKAFEIKPDGSIIEVDPKTGIPISKMGETEANVNVKTPNNKGFTESFYKDLFKANAKSEYNRGLKAGLPDEVIDKYLDDMEAKINNGEFGKYEDLQTWLKKNGYEDYISCLTGEKICVSNRWSKLKALRKKWEDEYNKKKLEEAMKNFKDQTKKEIMKEAVDEQVKEAQLNGVPQEALDTYEGEMYKAIYEGNYDEYEDLNTWLSQNGYPEYSGTPSIETQEGYIPVSEGESQALQKLGNPEEGLMKDLTKPEQAIMELRELSHFTLENPSLSTALLDTLGTAITPAIAQGILDYASQQLGTPVTTPQQLEELGLSPDIANTILEKSGALAGVNTNEILNLKQWINQERKQLNKGITRVTNEVTQVQRPEVTTFITQPIRLTQWVTTPQVNDVWVKQELTTPVELTQRVTQTQKPVITQLITHFIRVTRWLSKPTPIKDIWVPQKVIVPVELTEWVTTSLTQPLTQPVTQINQPNTVTMVIPKYVDIVVPSYQVMQKYVEEGQAVPPPKPGESPLPIPPLIPPLTPPPKPAGLGGKGKVKRGRQYEVIEL